MTITRQQARYLSMLPDSDVDAFFENVGIARYVRAFSEAKPVEWRKGNDFMRYTKNSISANFDMPSAVHWRIREKPSDMRVSAQERELIEALRAVNAISVKPLEYTETNCEKHNVIAVETDCSQERVHKALKALADDLVERIF